MLRPFAVDIARTLPAEAGIVNPAPQCAGTDHNALCVQMCGEQWHGPGVGVIPELARIARQQLTELGIRQGRRHARTTGSFAISQRRWRSFGKIEPFPLALAHGVGSNSLFSRASSPVRVFRRERDLL